VISLALKGAERALLQTRFDNAQSGAGMLTQRHGLLIGMAGPGVESAPPCGGSGDGAIRGHRETGVASFFAGPT